MIDSYPTNWHAVYAATIDCLLHAELNFKKNIHQLFQLRLGDFSSNRTENAYGHCKIIFLSFRLLAYISLAPPIIEDNHIFLMLPKKKKYLLKISLLLSDRNAKSHRNQDFCIKGAEMRVYVVRWLKLIN
jgi:hypothetical protein